MDGAAAWEATDQRRDAAAGSGSAQADGTGAADPGAAQHREGAARPGDQAGEAAGDGLTDRERDILAFERQWWKYAGAKEDAIKEVFGLSATRYYQILNALVDGSAALAADPLLVKRLRRLRASRQKARAARRLGITIT